MRIVVALALTGFALVATRRRIRLRSIPLYRHVSTPAASAAPATSSEAPPAETSDETKVATTAPVSADTAPDPPATDAVILPGPVRRSGGGPSEQAVAFDLVMARVSTLIDAASRSTARTGPAEVQMPSPVDHSRAYVTA